MSDDELFLPRAATPAARPVTGLGEEEPAQVQGRRTTAPRSPHASASPHATPTSTPARSPRTSSTPGTRTSAAAASTSPSAPSPRSRSCANESPAWPTGSLNLQPHELPQFFKEIYLGHWIKRPDLINRALRLHDWAWNPDPDNQQLRAVHAVTHRAINTGLLDLTGHDDPYCAPESDVLSPLLTGLRHKSDKKWRGEYHTPPCVTDLMANILVDKDFARPGHGHPRTRRRLGHHAPLRRPAPARPRPQPARLHLVRQRHRLALRSVRRRQHDHLGPRPTRPHRLRRLPRPGRRLRQDRRSQAKDAFASATATWTPRTPSSPPAAPSGSSTKLMASKETATA